MLAVFDAASGGFAGNFQPAGTFRKRKCGTIYLQDGRELVVLVVGATYLQAIAARRVSKPFAPSWQPPERFSDSQ